MHNGGAEEIKAIITEFKKLASKIQQNNKKTLKERGAILQAYKNEYQKLYYENEALKKRCGELELAEVCRN